MLKKLFVFSGWLLLLCLVLMFSLTIGLSLGWGTITIFGVWLGILVTAVLLRTLLLWLTGFVKEKNIKRFFQKFRLSRHEYVLFEHWKSGAAIVKRLKRNRPAIPWYILLGDRCGKTSLLAGSDLPMYSNNVDDRDVVPTQTLRWWFFRNVCILDVSSHFLNGKAIYHRAWGKLVGWIARTPAPSGIVIAISVADFLNEDFSMLHDKARKIRVQLEPLTRKLKRRLPLYLIVTQCDQFPTFSLWRQQLSADQQQQALGYYWQTPPDVDGKDASTLLPLFAALKNGLDLSRISMGGTPIANHPALLEFPESFACLQNSLRVFLASLCEPNAYFTPVTLGGVWFTASEKLETNKSRRTSYFIHDLLTHHLPVFSTSREVVWHRNNRVQATLGYMLLVGCVLGLGYSAIKNAAVMQRDITRLRPAQLAQLLVSNESLSHTPLTYLPFSPISDRQHQQVERKLVAELPPRQVTASLVLTEFQNQFNVASAQMQRQMILDLAQTILTHQSMRDGATLKALSQRPVTPAELRLTASAPAAAPLVQLTLDRYVAQQPAGKDQLIALRQLLISLIRGNSNLSWLVAPADSLPPLQSSDYWPQSAETTSLSGIWTHQGEVQLNAWVTLINQALASPEPEPTLQHFMQTLPVQRQDAWHQFLLSLTPSLQTVIPRTLTQSQLISLSIGQSPSMKFAQLILSELDNITTDDAQPWLKELRKINEMRVLSTASPTLQKVKYADNKLRSMLGRWLPVANAQIPSQAYSLHTDIWRKWQTARNQSANKALNQATLSPELTAGLFTPVPEAKTSNPLVTLFTSYDQLRRISDPQEQQPGIDAVWSLYQSDANTLLAHALARSGCWLNTEWQSKVMWPMRKNAATQDYDTQQALTWQYLADFMRGPAKGLLIVNDQGPQAGEFHGQSLPLTPQFLSIARNILNPEDVMDIPVRQNVQDEDRLATVNDEIEKTYQEAKNTFRSAIYSQCHQPTGNGSGRCSSDPDRGTFVAGLSEWHYRTRQYELCRDTNFPLAPWPM
ncbi:type VI secretion protein IcmF/TssM N-terminal domain-containing protein [Rahnella woolbedingensis]|uniref:Type VI secretion system component TssM1 N-terminal domain-containing protein n=1 Tax=Rahnella woolbedingensis TaxID=1510574 RepID=A0A419N2W7_9GAMM|nr:type VI secretion protein IcmF/TssM N-terminal domain-containing protein [Rahnella woolbedingensis]RJT36261.1 hypothetical protein D6C13_22590 [Rahnella woolbedingensis]